MFIESSLNLKGKKMNTLNNFKIELKDKITAVYAKEVLGMNYSDITVLKIKSAAKGCYAITYKNSGNQICVELWKSSRIKTPQKYRFSNGVQRLLHINKWIGKQQRSQAYKTEKKENNKLNGTGLQAGDVLSAAWGYDQTNYNYYQVTKVVGKTMVELREIAAMKKETGDMRGEITPIVSDFIGEPIRKKAANGGVRICSVIYATKMEYLVVANTRLYSANHYTAYH